MKYLRIKAILLQESFLSFRSLEIIMDLVFFPIMSIIVFGFLSIYLSGFNNFSIGRGVLLGMLLWQVIWIVQYSVALGSLWNIWSRNLSNLFVTPLTVREYIFAQAFSGILKMFIIFLGSSVVCFYFFNFNILDIGIANLAIVILNLMLFGFALGLVILGLIFRFGTRIQAFAWGILPFFQLITAAFYPVSVLPPFLQNVAYTLPPTYVFEATRGILNGLPMDMHQMSTALLLNIFYLTLAIISFDYNFKKSKESGQFARNEG